MNVDNQWNMKKNIQKMVDESIRTSHTEPSPETRERLIKLETCMEQNVKDHQELKELILGIKTDLKDALETKAGRWVEKVIIWTGIAIGGTLVAFITWLIKDGAIHLIK